MTTVNGFSLALGQTFTILQDSGNTLVSGAFANAPGGVYADAAGDTFLVNYPANTDGGTLPNDVTLTVLTVVPEPGTWMIVAGGLGALAAAGVRQRSAAQA